MRHTVTPLFVTLLIAAPGCDSTYDHDYFVCLRSSWKSENASPPSVLRLEVTKSQAQPANCDAFARYRVKEEHKTPSEMVKAEEFLVEMCSPTLGVDSDIMTMGGECSDDQGMVTRLCIPIRSGGTAELALKQPVPPGGFVQFRLRRYYDGDYDGVIPTCTGEVLQEMVWDYSFCGDAGIDLDAGEVCDGSNLGGNTCASVSSEFSGGTLSCDASCDFDTSECLP